MQLLPQLGYPDGLGTCATEFRHGDVPLSSIERGEPREVVIRFTPEQACYMMGKRWHPTQVTEEQADGSLILCMRVGGLGELKRWVLQYGAGTEVLAPPELRQMVADEICCMSRTYGPVEQPTALTPPG